MTKYKIPLLLTIILSSILFVSTILFSILQTNTKPNLPNPDEIKIYKQSTSADATHKKGTNEYNKLIDLYNSMFEKTYLQQLGDNEILSNNLHEDTFAPLWSDVNKETGVFVEFVYSSPKKFIIHRGNNSRRVDVSSIIFEISKEDSSKQLYIYYTVKEEESSSNDKKDETKRDPEPYYPIVTQANTYDMFKHLISSPEEIQ